MSSTIKIDIYTIFFIPLICVCLIFAFIRNKLLRNGCVRWLTRLNWRLWLLLVFNIDCLLWFWIFIWIDDRVNKLDEHIAPANRSSCFFENYRWESQIKLMNAISNLTWFSIAKLHYTVSDQLLFWLSSSRIIGVSKSFNEHKHGLCRFLRPILSVKVHI